MRLGTKILLLTLAATVGLSGTVIWLVTRDVTAREVDRARRTIKSAVSGYFASVDERHQRDAALVTLIMGDAYPRLQLDLIEAADAKSREAPEAQLADVIFGKHIQGELTYADISPAFHVLLNSRGELRVASAPDNPQLSKALASQSWPYHAVLTGQSSVRQYLWINKVLYLAMGVPLRANRDEDPTHAYFVGYRVDDQWLGKLLRLVREDASRREESLAVISAWF